jgi:hypothetical protein
MGDDLELNRLRKRGHGLVLEEHSSCEVPAGCGGVVLRWARPDSPCDVDLRHFGPKELRVWIDGAELKRERVVLSPGAHALCFEYHPSVVSQVLVATLKLPHRKVSRLKLHTSADGTWRCSWEEPSADWTSRDFDDSGWEAMVARDALAPTDRTEKWRMEWLTGEGATPIGPSSPPRGAPSRTLRVRRRFELTAEGLS